MVKIEIVSIKKKFFQICDDSELLHNDDLKRPYLIILKLKYRGKKIDFAIPFRSNIPPSAKEWNFILCHQIAQPKKLIIMDYIL